jgi:hypothetical protein
LPVLDSESYEWAPLNDDFFLAHKPVSLSHGRRRELRNSGSPTRPEVDLGLDPKAAKHVMNGINDINLEDSSGEKSRSIFRLGMPGIMAIEEIIALVCLESIQANIGERRLDLGVSSAVRILLP